MCLASDMRKQGTCHLSTNNNLDLIQWRTGTPYQIIGIAGNNKKLKSKIKEEN